MVRMIGLVVVVFVADHHHHHQAHTTLYLRFSKTKKPKKKKKILVALRVYCVLCVLNTFFFSILVLFHIYEKKRVGGVWKQENARFEANVKEPGCLVLILLYCLCFYHQQQQQYCP